MVNGHDIGHGGLTFAVADTAFAFACNSHGPVTVAHSADIRFHAPVRAGRRVRGHRRRASPARSAAGCTTWRSPRPAARGRDASPAGPPSCDCPRRPRDPSPVAALVLALVVVVAAAVFWLRDDAEPAAGTGPGDAGTRPDAGRRRSAGEAGGAAAIPDELGSPRARRARTALPRRRRPRRGLPAPRPRPGVGPRARATLTGTDHAGLPGHRGRRRSSSSTSASRSRSETVTLDGDEVDAQHNGKDLVVHAPVKADEKLRARGRATPAPPSRRGADHARRLQHHGLDRHAEGEVWTMQEPYGAYTWYPVNDQPADKALYDFTITVPAPWIGVANGELHSTEDDGRRRHGSRRGTRTSRRRRTSPRSRSATTRTKSRTAQRRADHALGAEGRAPPRWRRSARAARR